MSLKSDNHDESAEPSKDWQQEVNALRQMCTILGVDTLVERSRSGRGAHVWIFFSDPIQASKARKFGEALLRKGAESVSLKTFTYYDRMMPMQDSLPEGKLGNLIALPLQGRALQNGNSAFVDESWMTYKDQWKRLRETRKLGEKEIDELIKLWCPDDDTMSIFQNDIEEESTGQAPLLFGQRPASRRNFHAEDTDDVVKIYLSDGIYINKKGVLAAATAFGKTVLGAYMIAQKKANALVLVHNVEIMNNWIKDLNSFLTINEELLESAFF